MLQTQNTVQQTCTSFSACGFWKGFNLSDVEQLMWLKEIFLLTFPVDAWLHVFCFVYPLA